MKHEMDTVAENQYKCKICVRLLGARSHVQPATLTMYELLLVV